MEPQLELVRQLHCGESSTIELLKRQEDGGYLVRHRLMGQPPDDVYRALQTVRDSHLPEIYDYKSNRGDGRHGEKSSRYFKVI